MSLALIFPGQGSQTPGMGKALAENFKVARDVFAEVDDALDQKLSQLAFEGPEVDLILTSNAQPALMAVSMAALRVLEAEAGLDIARDCAALAGHSLGEYSALAAAGVLSLRDTARLLRLRGDAMQRAVPAGVGAMAALLGAQEELAAGVCAEAAKEAKQICQIANDNGGGQIVISGHKAAVERAGELAKERGVKRTVLLPVSAPFHCALMAPAAREMQDAFAEVTFHAPKAPIVTNVLAEPISNAHRFAELLVRQVTGTVRWRESMQAMAASGMETFAEVGAGKVLSGLAKRLAPNAKSISVGSPEDIAAFVAFHQA